MNFHRQHQGRRKDVYLNFTSMIDVMFNLMIYFCVTTSLTAPESALKPTLQVRGGGARGADFAPQVLQVRGDEEGRPAWLLGAREIHGREELLRILAALPKEPGMIVEVRDEARVEAAAAALQACQDAGFTKITYMPGEGP